MSSRLGVLSPASPPQVPAAKPPPGPRFGAPSPSPPPRRAKPRRVACLRPRSISWVMWTRPDQTRTLSREPGEPLQGSLHQQSCRLRRQCGSRRGPVHLTPPDREKEGRQGEREGRGWDQRCDTHRCLPTIWVKGMWTHGLTLHSNSTLLQWPRLLSYRHHHATMILAVTRSLAQRNTQPSSPYHAVENMHLGTSHAAPMGALGGRWAGCIDVVMAVQSQPARYLAALAALR